MERERILRMKLTRKLDCAVQVIDDFTGRPVSGSAVQVTAPDLPQAKAVRKSDGFFLFLKGNWSLKKLQASGPCYTTEGVEIDSSTLDVLKPIVRIRISPSRSYNFPTGTTGIWGKAETNNPIYLFCRNGDMSASLVLLQDYVAESGSGKAKVGNNMIHLFSSERGNLEGKTFVILPKGQTKPEIFTIAEEDVNDEQGLCRLEKPLLQDYKKGTIEILPVCLGKADQEQNYILPIRNALEEPCNCHISTDGKNWKEISVKTGTFSLINI